MADADVRWHLIGHLQRNKIERTIALVALVHSADSLRLIEALDAAAGTQGRRLPILLEVNVSGDVAKHGFQPGEIEPHLETLTGYQHVEIRGLMAMAGRKATSIRPAASLPRYGSCEIAWCRRRPAG